MSIAEVFILIEERLVVQHGCALVFKEKSTLINIGILENQERQSMKQQKTEHRWNSGTPRNSGGTTGNHSKHPRIPTE